MTRYWLTQCEGFRVQGPVKGTVEEVLGSVDTHSVQALVVRRAGRRRNVPVAAVASIVPAARLIVVQGLESPDVTQRRRAHAALATIAAKGPPVGRFLADAGRAFVVFVAAVLVTLARTLRTSTLALAATGARLVEDASVRRRAAAHRRRRATTRQSTGEGRRLTRAAVLGVDRRGTHKP